LALCTAFTANAKVENGKVYQLTNEDGKYLSVTGKRIRGDFFNLEGLQVSKKRVPLQMTRKIDRLN